MGGWGVSIGTAATDWANDGLFGDGWFLSGGDGYEDDAGDFESAGAIIEAYENGESVVYFYDDDSGETEEVPVDAAVYAEAQETVAQFGEEGPDPSDYGHWQDGIGPRESRKKIVNTNWGGVTEDNSFGTHEFLELCRQLGCGAAVLKERSPSCGRGEIYDGTFSGRLAAGDGVTAALLASHGVPVYGESRIEELLK
jgi:hypothetical protein